MTDAESRLLKDSTDIKALRDYLNSIPADKWCQNEFKTSDGKRCVRGHINELFTHNPFDIGFKPFMNLKLTLINDGAPNNKIKETVLMYLDKVIVGEIVIEK